MTRRIARAVQADGVILGRTALEEGAALEDHALAHRLNGNNIDSEVHLHPQAIDDATLSKLASLYISKELGRKLATDYDQLDLEEGAEEEPEISTWAAFREDTHDDNLNH